MITSKVKKYIDQSVLCWLATTHNNQPNVSPKQVFTYFDNKSIIIANIASPQTVRNIKHNENVCISFIDIFVQKGYQLKGKAKIIDKTDTEFSLMKTVLLKMTKGKYPFNSIIKIAVGEVKEIIDPKYIFYPKTTEKEQIEGAKGLYLSQYIES